MEVNLSLFVVLKIHVLIIFEAFLGSFSPPPPGRCQLLARYSGPVWSNLLNSVKFTLYKIKLMNASTTCQKQKNSVTSKPIFSFSKPKVLSFSSLFSFGFEFSLPIHIHLFNDASTFLSISAIEVHFRALLLYG